MVATLTYSLQTVLTAASVVNTLFIARWLTTTPTFADGPDLIGGGGSRDYETGASPFSLQSPGPREPPMGLQMSHLNTSTGFAT